MTNRTTRMTLSAATILVGAAASAQGLALPMLDNFESGFLDSSVWVPGGGAGVSGSGVNEPSPVFSMVLDGIDEAQTTPLDSLATLIDQGPVVTVSFWAQHRGVEFGESLQITYRDVNGVFQELDTLVSNGASQTSFVFYQYALPLDGYSEDLAIKFKAFGNQSNDDWFIDNFRVGPFGGNNVPWTDDFEDGIDVQTEWAVVFNANTATGVAGNEPSGTSALRLNSDDSIETVNLLMGVEPARSQQLYFRFWFRTDDVEPTDRLRVEYFDADANDDGVTDDPAYKLFEEIDPAGSARPCFTSRQYAIPMVDNTDNFRIRFVSVSDEVDDVWYIDDVTISPTALTIDPNCPGLDFATPCGMGTFADISQFLNWFTTSDPRADLAAPQGQLTFADIGAFLGAFNGGCNETYGEPD
jgi:hypothetical protein